MGFANGVQLFISHPPRWLGARRSSSSKPTIFDPLVPQSIEKTKHFANFLPFAHFDFLSTNSFFFGSFFH